MQSQPRGGTMENLQKFIKDYFGLLNLTKMPEAVKSHYDKLVANNDFPNKTVKSWSKSMKPNGSWKNLPDFSTLSDEELNLLYIDLLRTFGAMSSHMGKFDEDTKNFVNKFYGAGKLFNVPPIQPNVKQQIDGLIQLLLNDSNVATLASLDYGEDEILKEVSLGRKKHESDEVKRLIFKTVKNLQQALQDPNYQQYLSGPLAQFDLNNIQRAIKPFSIDDVTDQNRNDLKTNCEKIFGTLFEKKKTFEAFKSYEPGEKFVSEQIDKALSDTDYTGKINPDNYVAPTYKDDLNWRQKLDKKLEDTYSDVLKKYLTLHRANLTITKTAPAIIKQFDKAKIKPTDGIKAILEKSGDITNGLKGKEPFAAADHFKWMIEKLTSYEKNGMGKAIEGALRNRRQMEHIIEQMIFDAVDEGKIDQAKTAMEVLSIMQYGMFTSRRMDAINQTDMTILSDGKLSWNKNEGIQFVTKAMDKTLKTGIQLAGYTTTAIANKVFRRPSRVLEKSKLKDKLVDKKNNLDAEKTSFNTDKQTQDATDNAEIQRNNNRITTSGIANDTDLTNKKNQLANDRNIEDAKKSSFESAEQTFAQWEQHKSDYERLRQLSIDRVNISREIGQLKAELRAMPNPAPDQNAEFEAQTKKQEIDTKQQSLNNLEQEYDTIKNRYPFKTVNRTTGATVIRQYSQRAYNTAETDMNNAKNAYEQQKNNNDTLQHNINEYEDARDIIKETQKQIDVRQEKANKWDEEHKNGYTELWAHWEFLQSGKTKSLFHISTKKLQKKMDNGEMKNRYNDFYAQWLKSHPYAA